MVLGRAVYIPMSDSPPKLAYPLNETSLNHSTPYVYASNFTEVYSNLTRVEFDEISTVVAAVDESEHLGCPITQEWCKTTKGMTISQFLLGYTFTAIGYPIGVTLITTIFSKILGPRPQGTWMGIMTGSGCLSRALGPVFLSTIYTKLGLYWTFGSTAVMMAGTMMWLWLVRDRLIPSEYENPSAGQELQTVTSKKDPGGADPSELEKLNGKAAQVLERPDSIENPG